MKKLSIIIVSYNTKEFLQNCIQSLYKYQDRKISYEIIVVDNASLDNTSEMVSSEFPCVVFVRNSENMGFSKANNIGIRKSHGDYVLFLNPDTVIHEFTISKLIQFMESHEDAGAATCKVELLSGELDDAAHRGFPTPWNSFCHFSGLARIFPKSRIFAGYSLGYLDLATVHEIDACAGAFMIVRREAGEQIRWWDEDFFFYGEDLDFCYRLKEKGFKIYYVPDGTILHYKGISGGIKKHSQHLSTADFETKKLAQKARFDAMKIFYTKHYKNKYPTFITWLVMKAITLRSKLRV